MYPESNFDEAALGIVRTRINSVITAVDVSGIDIPDANMRSSDSTPDFEGYEVKALIVSKAGEGTSKAVTLRTPVLTLGFVSPA